MSNSKSRLFYGWIIVIAGLVVMSISVGIVVNGFSLYIKPMVADMGVERRFIAFAISLAEIIIMIGCFVSGKIYSKVSFLKLFKIAAVVFPIAYFCFSLCKSLWQLYLIYVVIGIFNPFISVLPLSIIITNWFNKSRATAIGICFMGSGIGGMLFASVGNMIIEAFGWRTLAMYTSFFMFIALVPIAFLILKEKPADMGLEPLGGFEKSVTENNGVESGLTIGESVRTFEFYKLLIIAVILGHNATILCNNVVTHVSDVGFSNTYAAALTSILMAALAVGKIVFGKVCDLFGIRKAGIASFISIALGLTALTFAQYKAMHPLIVIGNFFGCPISTVGYPLLAQSIFGKKSYVQINGYVTSANYLGVAIAPLLANYIYDISGSYNQSFILGIALTVFALITFIFIKPKYTPEAK